MLANAVDHSPASHNLIIQQEKIGWSVVLRVQRWKALNLCVPSCPSWLNELRLHQPHIDRHLILARCDLQACNLRASFICSVQQVHVDAAPLLEEKWDLGPQALISNLRDPFLHDRSRAGIRLTADDHLIVFAA